MKEKDIGDTMTCVEKRHMSHRVGAMLHHRFPNGFTDMFMDETDREVSTLTDRAFRSLCIGDDAVYNDEFTYGYSPFSCHKPLAGEPNKKTAKEAKKHGQTRNDKHESHQQKTMSQMSSFLQALSATEESYGGVFKKNGLTDSNGESWDKSALRSIQKELSEFSTDYHAHLTEGHYKKHKHHPGNVSTNKTSKDNSLSPGNSSKSKHFKTNVKLKKLNIKNFFLHSEFSPFQTWADMNRFSFAQETIVSSILPEDPVPKWYDLPFYKELTEEPEKETALTESCQKELAEPPLPPPTEPKPIPPPVPPKVLPKPLVTTAEKRCTSEGGDGTAAPWRRNRSRATSAVPITQPRITTQDTVKQVDENLLLLKKVDENLLLLKKVDENLTLFKKEARSVDVKTVEEVNSLASTPFSICQLMTPIIPSRQPTETSEILTVLSPSALELPLRPQSEAKVTPEPPLKRDGYKSLASSILFNLKDNRKRVKSRYSPRKFKTLEETESGSPLSDQMKQVFSEGLASGMSTPAIVKDVEIVGSPLFETHVQSVDLTKHDTERPLSNDYLLSHLLQSKPEVEASPMSPLLQVKKNKSPLAKKQIYPSLNLYKKAGPDSDMKSLQVPLSPGASVHTESVKNYLSPTTVNKDISPLPKTKTSGLLSNSPLVNRDFSPEISSPAVEKKDISLKEKVVKRPPDVPEKPKRKNSIEPISLKENNVVNQSVSASNLIKAAREALNAAKHKALTAPVSINKPTDELNKVRNTQEQEQKSQNIIVMEEISTPENIPNADKKKEPPPVPKRTFTKSDIPLSLDNPESFTNGDLDSKTDVKSKSKKEASQKQGKLKHIFSARQNNYIKNQRFAIADNKDVETEESDRKVSVSLENELEATVEIKESDNIISDLNALKELERARLAERICDNAKNKLGVVDIVEQTKARNDLISRELRNIKKGMLSMRGNTMAKKDIFSKKENEQGKGEVYSKLDSNVIVNKALINDNYDKAKMALEEIIFEREKRKNLPGQEETDEGAEDESHELANVQKQNSSSETEVKANGFSASELKERLSDLRDHNKIRLILSQTEPRLGETHRAGTRIPLPGMDKVSDELHSIVKSKNEKIEKLISNYLTSKSSQASEESVENIVEENTEKKHDVPPVPPRSRKSSIRRDSVGKETELSLKNVIDDFNKNETSEKEELCLIPYSNYNCLEKQKAYETEPSTNLDNPKHDTSKSSSVANNILSIKTSENENKSYLSQEVTHESKKQVTPVLEIISERKIHPSGTGKVKRRAPLPPDHLITSNSKDSLLDQSVKTFNSNEYSKPETEMVVESPPNIISPLILVNGVSVCQSPPDQASLSSKSSYFSAESTLHRNTETESNVYNSLENLIGEVDEAHEEDCASLNKTRHNSDRTEYYSFSDHESESEPLKRHIKSPQKDPVILTKETGDKCIKENPVKEDETNSSASSNPVSPSFAIPALFKVKDNTFVNKLKKSILPWSPRGSLAGIETLVADDKNLEAQESHEERVIADATVPPDNTGVEEVLPLPPQLIVPTSPPSEKLKVQDDCFLRVPEQQDRNSEVSPLSEEMESTVDTADEMGVASGLECEVSKVPSERSGSTCSGNDSQTGLPKPPAVLPKSEKAVLKAIKLTNRRIKKEEAHKSTQKPSHSSSKHKSDRHKSEKSEHKSSSSSRKSGERKHKEKTHSVNQTVEEKPAHSSHNPNDMTQATQRQSVDSVENSNRNGAALLSERQGRSSDKRVREKPEQRHYSSDRVISNVPVYKTYAGDQPRSDRPFQRSLSTDRYMENKVERRLSADMSINDRLNPRSQRIEKSIMEELQQRGRQKDKQTKESPHRRSHSIDSQSTNVIHPANLSRQSSNTSQFSRQSSIEHAIVAPSFPMTQRKLLQDPDSGQYFFVDMPVQVKTKTFFDPETGTYVQFPVQPPEGAIPQASPMEVLSPPLMVYHSFVPVSLSPMAQTAPVQVPHVEHEEYERHPEVMTRHMEAHPYIEPVFGPHEHMLGEFLGTEELDCPS